MTASLVAGLLLGAAVVAQLQLRRVRKAIETLDLQQRILAEVQLKAIAQIDPKPTGVLTIPGEVSPERADEIRKQWEQVYGSDPVKAAEQAEENRRPTDNGQTSTTERTDEPAPKPAHPQSKREADRADRHGAHRETSSAIAAQSDPAIAKRAADKIAEKKKPTISPKLGTEGFDPIAAARRPASTGTGRTVPKKLPAVPEGYVKSIEAAKRIGCSDYVLKARIADQTFSAKKHPSRGRHGFTWIIPERQVEIARAQYEETGRVKSGSLNLKGIG